MATLQNDRRNVPRLSAQLAYQGLPTDAARVFRLLPVHPGPDVRAAVVAALADIPLTDAHGALLALDRVGLVRAVPGGEDRWRMHYRVRAYAGRLSRAHATTDGRELARDRLLRHYQTTTEAADGRLRGRPPIPVPQEFDDRKEALAWLDTERASLLAVTRMAADASRDHAAKSLPLLMAYYLNFRRFFGDLLFAAAIGLDAARRLRDQAAEGEALNNLGGALTGLGRYDEALSAYQAALAALRQTGDQQATGAALNNLGIALRALGRHDEAHAAYQEAAAVFRETGDQHGLAMTLCNLGNVLRSLGQPADAVGIYQEAIGIFRETCDRPREVAARESLATVQAAP